MVQISIDGLNMSVIEIDTTDVQPFSVGSFMVNVAQVRLLYT
jgi:hypothetical protein